MRAITPFLMDVPTISIHIMSPFMHDFTIIFPKYLARVYSH